MIKKMIDIFNHMKIRKKLLVSFLVVFLLTAAVAVTGIISLISTRVSFSYMINYPHERYIAYTNAKYQLISLRYNSIYMTLLAGDERALDERLELSNYVIELIIKDLEYAKLNLMQDLLMKDDIKQSRYENIDDMISGVHNYRDSHLIPFCELMKKNEISNEEMHDTIYQGIAIINPFVESLNEMLASAEIVMRNTQISSNMLSLHMLWLLVGIAVVSAIISLFLAMYVSGLISKPIVKLVEIADNVANGNLDVKIDVESYDETGVLSKRFAHVVGYINLFIKDLHDLGHAFKIDGDTTVRLNESQYKGTYAQVATAMNDILDYHVESKDEILECISNIVDGEYDAPLRQFPGRESRINVSVDILRINVRRMEQIMMQKAESDAANKAKSSFLANMSHEIRTPMNAILGVTEILLNNNQLPEEISEGLGKIYNSCDLLLGIINDILDFSKIEAGKLDIVPAPYKISSLLSDSIQLNMMRIESKPIEFELVIDEDIPANLFGDELRIKQILNNLLSNAFKYTDVGKVIMSVSYKHIKEKEGITLIISIKDTGHGMTQEQLEKLFVEYSRFHQKVNRTVEGTGLGLSITLSLVELMGGDINVESEPNVGSVFTVELPQKIVDSEILGSEAAENLRQFRMNQFDQRKRSQIVREYMPYGTALIVDDVETNLFVAEGLLKLYDIQIESVMSGKEAINKIKEGKVYDVIFMDHMMPEMDGIEAVKHIRNLGYTAPIVALTANAVAGQADMFLKSGFNDFISKPIDIRQLNAALNKYVRDKQPEDVLSAARQEAAAREKIKKAESKYLKINTLLLDSFIRDAHKTAELLDNLLKQDALKSEEDIRKFTVAVHGIKSSLANIGEVALSKTAAQLEQDGKSSNVDSIIASTPDFIIQLRKLLEKIEQKRNSDAEEDEEDLLDKIIEIQKACTDYDRKLVLDLITNIKQRSKWTNTILENIMGYVLHSDFEQAEREAAAYADILYGR